MDVADRDLQTPVPTTAALTASHLLDTLEDCLHASKTEWIFLRELRVGTGHRQHSMQRLDAFALNCLPHLAMKRVCYEVKMSRADFLSERKHPLKRRIGLRYSNEFFFVTPAGMLACDEVPVECGLIEVGIAETEESCRLVRSSHQPFQFAGNRPGLYCTTVIPAPWRETPGPTWQLVAAMLRNQRRCFEEKPPPAPKQQKLPWETSPASPD